MSAAKDAWRRSDTAEKTISRQEIEAQIAEGRHIIIVDGNALKVDAWLPYHPGGDKAIKHMVGRDATDEVNALHSLEARDLMNKYLIGRVEGRWDNFIPPIQGGKFRSRQELADAAETEYHDDGSSTEVSQEPSPIFEASEPHLSTFRRKKPRNCSTSRSSSATSISFTELDSTLPKMSYLDIRTRDEIKFDIESYPPLDPDVQDDIVDKYRQLNERIKAEGLYQCNYSAYAVEICRYSLLFMSFIFLLRKGWYFLSAIFLGLFWHQLVFSAHDAGHMGITHDFTIDTTIGIIIADFMGGLSLGWWKRNHNVHHIVTNSPEHDPDIQHMPLFAVSHRFLESLRSTYYDRVMAYDSVAKVVIKLQDYLYYPILGFGRFNLYRLSWEYLLLGQAPRKGPAWWTRWLEIAGQIFFWYWFGYVVMYQSVQGGWNRFAFLMVSHIVTSPVHIQITLSHFAMSTSDLGPRESFPQKMLRTTMDVDCPPWLDFIHGGLQFQAIHHLYPRIPRHNLRRAQKLVIEFCDEVKIPYAIYGFVEGNKQVLSRLEQVARQAAILTECRKTMATSKDYGMH